MKSVVYKIFSCFIRNSLKFFIKIIFEKNFTHKSVSLKDVQKGVVDCVRRFG